MKQINKMITVKASYITKLLKRRRLVGNFPNVLDSFSHFSIHFYGERGWKRDHGGHHHHVTSAQPWRHI